MDRIILKIICTALFTFYLVQVSGQANPNIHSNPSIQSPNTYSLGRYGNVPVSLFNGLPAIEVPIYEIKNGDISIPLKLRYNAGGNRPDEHPGWVGSGWSLETGGVITRRVNGQVDEYVSFPIFYNDNLFSQSYYNKKADLATADWVNTNLQPSLAADEFTFNILGLTGSFYLDHLGNWRVKSKENLNLKIEHEIKQSFQLIHPEGIDKPNYTGSKQVIPRTYTKFIVTASDGTIYKFGGDQKSIEFSRSPILIATESGEEEVDDGAERSITATAWYLTEIITADGQRVEFKYSCDGFNLVQTTYSEIFLDKRYREEDNNNANDINMIHQYLINNVHLESITVPNILTVNFARSRSLELSYPTVTSQDWYYWYEDLGGGPALLKNLGWYDFAGRDLSSIPIKYYKLDYLEIRNANDDLIKKVVFQYNENSQERLKLLKLAFKDSEDRALMNYTFEYNSLRLPEYNKGMEDHWGFYNGRNFWNSNRSQSQTIPDANNIPNLASYYESREPDANFVQAEILTKVVYPTGGYSEFVYELHDYSSIVKQYPLSVESVAQNKTAGGLRVKKIIDYDGKSGRPFVREFFYAKDYINGGRKSSGVVSGLPTYFEEGADQSRPDKKFFRFSSNPSNYFNNTNGNHVTYSEVVEKSDHGYIVHLYTNHDNGYLDKPPFRISFRELTSTTDQSLAYNKVFGSLELERGLELKTLYYSMDKVLVREEQFEYNDNPARYNEYVRAVSGEGFRMAGVTLHAAYPVYTFYPFLKKSSIIEYTGSGSQRNITVKSFLYEDRYRLLREEMSNDSKGQAIKKTYRYVFDLLPESSPMINAKTHPYRYMILNNIIGTPIEELSSLQRLDGVSVITNSVVRTYKGILVSVNGVDRYITQLDKIYESLVNIPWTNQMMSLNFTGDSESVVLSPTLQMKTSFDAYDLGGNVSQLRANDNTLISYLWGNNLTQPIAKGINTLQSDIAYTSFEEESTTRPLGNWILIGSGRIKDASSLFGHYIFSLCGNVYMQKKMLDPSKIYTVSYWSKNGSYDVTGEMSVKNVDAANGWTKYEHQVTSVSDLTIRGCGQIDNVRLFPKGANFITSVYIPFIGSLVREDANGIKLFYDYDTYNRLRTIRGNNRGIIRQYDYHFLQN